MSDEAPKPVIALKVIDPPEKSRTYVFPPRGEAASCNYKLENVTALAVSPSGVHRVETADGGKHIIAPGWIAIKLEMDKWSF